MSDAGQNATPPIGEVRLEDILQNFRETAETEHLSVLSAKDIEAQAASMAKPSAAALTEERDRFISGNLHGCAKRSANLGEGQWPRPGFDRREQGWGPA